MNKFILILLLTSGTQASEVTFKYGFGVGNSAIYSISETKLFELGYNQRYWQYLSYQFSVGAWVDNRTGEGRSSSGYTSLQTGLDLSNDNLRVYSLHGVGAISSPDTYLGSVPQFFHDIGVGVIDPKTKANITIEYKHISNAGIFSGPNVGRDFIAIRLGFPF